MGSETYHEPYEILSPRTREMHRAIISLMEELEAIDWYQQRADACEDEALAKILLHNLEEEIEHAMMTLEWIRRKSPAFDREMRTYLFTERPILEVEEAAEDGAEEATDLNGGPIKRRGHDGSLAIGRLA